MIQRIKEFFKKVFQPKRLPLHKVPSTEEEFADIERRLDAGDNVELWELAHLLRYLHDKKGAKK